MSASVVARRTARETASHIAWCSGSVTARERGLETGFFIGRAKRRLKGLFISLSKPRALAQHIPSPKATLQAVSGPLPRRENCGSLTDSYHTYIVLGRCLRFVLPAGRDVRLTGDADVAPRARHHAENWVHPAKLLPLLCSGRGIRSTPGVRAAI